MGILSAATALQLPVHLRGIQLARPIDLLLDVVSWRAIGFVVRCGDESVRFLPYGAAQLTADGIAVQSALMLLDDVAFYERRGVSYRSLLDGQVEGEGALHDVILSRSGRIEALEVERAGIRKHVPAAGSTVVPTRATAA
jgi:hypothetical protein